MLSATKQFIPNYNSGNYCLKVITPGTKYFSINNFLWNNRPDDSNYFLALRYTNKALRARDLAYSQLPPPEATPLFRNIQVTAPFICRPLFSPNFTVLNIRQRLHIHSFSWKRKTFLWNRQLNTVKGWRHQWGDNSDRGTDIREECFQWWITWIILWRWE